MAAAPPRRPWDEIVGRIDRRIIYAGLILFTLAPLVFGLNLPIFVTPPVRNFREAIDELPEGKVVFVSSDWDAGTIAELEPQSIAIYRQLFRRRLKVVVFSMSAPTAQQIAQNALDEALRQEFGATMAAPDSYPKYGVDLVHAGYRYRSKPWVRSLVQNPTDALKTDWKATPLKQYPLFQEMKSLPESASMLIDIAAGDTVEDFIAFVASEGVPVNLGCTAVMAPEQYPYLATNQLRGLLTGMRGAAEYEKLLGIRGRATQMMPGQSIAHLYLFLLILLGNVGILGRWVRSRRRR